MGAEPKAFTQTSYLVPGKVAGDLVSRPKARLTNCRAHPASPAGLLSMWPPPLAPPLGLL